MNKKYIAPAWLNKDAKKVWNVKIAEIQKMKPAKFSLSHSERAVLALYCESLAEYQSLVNKKSLPH